MTNPEDGYSGEPFATVSSSKHTLFPLGQEVTLDELERDPYPVFARLREHEPITWLRALNMWYVTGYEDVRAAILDSEHLTTFSQRSPIFDTFGAHMLTTEGAAHERYRRATNNHFAQAFIRSHFEASVTAIAADLIKQLEHLREADMRSAFASRLPIHVILLVCGLPVSTEACMRQWYDSFEAALDNFSGNPVVRDAAHRSVRELHDALDVAIANAGGSDPQSLIARLVNAPAVERLTDDEIRRNLSIIFFGGISTVEALLLNTLWALFQHLDVFERVCKDMSLLPKVVEETMRWVSPVQSATRYVVEAYEWRGIHFQTGDVVNCMLGAANRDPTVFHDPDRFDIDRPNVRRHLGFATGPHTCLGSNLAKAEVRIGVERLLSSLRNLTLEPSLSEPPTGYEFRQSRKLTVRWSS